METFADGATFLRHLSEARLDFFAGRFFHPPASLSLLVLPFSRGFRQRDILKLRLFWLGSMNRVLRATPDGVRCPWDSGRLCLLPQKTAHQGSADSVAVFILGCIAEIAHFNDSIGANFSDSKSISADPSIASRPAAHIGSQNGLPMEVAQRFHEHIANLQYACGPREPKSANDGVAIAKPSNVEGACCSFESASFVQKQEGPSLEEARVSPP